MCVCICVCMFCVFLVLFSTGLVRLYIAGLPLRYCSDHWASVAVNMTLGLIPDVVSEDKSISRPFIYMSIRVYYVSISAYSVRFMSLCIRATYTSSIYPYKVTAVCYTNKTVNAQRKRLIDSLRADRRQVASVGTRRFRFGCLLPGPRVGRPAVTSVTSVAPNRGR